MYSLMFRAAVATKWHWPGKKLWLLSSFERWTS